MFTHMLTNTSLAPKILGAIAAIAGLLQAMISSKSRPKKQAGIKNESGILINASEGSTITVGGDVSQGVRQRIDRKPSSLVRPDLRVKQTGTQVSGNPLKIKYTFQVHNLGGVCHRLKIYVADSLISEKANLPSGSAKQFSWGPPAPIRKIEIRIVGIDDNGETYTSEFKGKLVDNIFSFN